MIDPATGWVEIKDIENKYAYNVANVVETTWLSRYPWPKVMTFDRGTEFMAEFAQMIRKDYGIKKKPTTTRNPQANSIVEYVHQTIGNVLRAFQVHDAELDAEDRWSGILSAIAFGVRSTVHTTLEATPMQLAFGRDSVMNMQHLADWKFVLERKQNLTNKNNERENAKRKPHRHKKGDLVMVKLAQSAKHGTDAFKGPFELLKVCDNGSVKVRQGKVTDSFNLRDLSPSGIFV